MVTIGKENKSYRLQFGGMRDGSMGSRSLHLMHANDQDNGDDFEGRRNWSFMLVLFAAFMGLTTSAALWSLF
ncbi:hypothetical protein [Neorhizobium alkalisoli]|uniref:hypothetical protein n=1 Tax=Neorhizobium alkalisoli TaxID=528178 RepID=UPI001319DBF8|nr:hypothetical protein [Neorhizobium alkalisoli]